MIADFLASWGLFHYTYLTGWLIGALLALVGVVVVARNQIFIGAAVSQASTFGIAAGMVVGDRLADAGLAWFGTDGFLSLMAVGFSVLAALATARRDAGGQASHEAMTGWVFLLSASLAILVVAHSPHGLEEVHRLLASSIIGATRADLWVFGVLALATVLVVWRLHRRLLLFAMDPGMAQAVGMRVAAWGVAVSVWLGLVLGLSIRCAGLLYAFGSLVLPALAARSVCREVRPMFVAAPLFALAAAALGFVLANHYDYPPGQMTVALLCALCVLAGLPRRLRARVPALVLLGLGLAGCGRPPPPPPPLGVRTVAVLPPQNHTGRELVVMGSWLLERIVLRGEKVTVPDVLAREARTQLAARGFAVGEPPAAQARSVAEAAEAARELPEGALLYLDVRRWDADVPQLEFIAVGIDAALVEGPSGRVIWQWTWDGRLVPTRGAPTVGAADETAARAVVAALIEEWRPADAR